MRVKILGLALALVVCAGGAWANGAPETKPEKVGLSSERLERISAAIQQDVESGMVPGAVGLVARDGQIAYFKAFGNADREAKTPMKPDTIFRIYSMSKPITSVALMMLYEEGKFMLKDPVARYLPEFAEMEVLIEKDEVKQGAVFHLPEEDEEGNVTNKPEIDPASYETVPAKRPITVQDLLRHTAGFSYGFFGDTTVDKMYRRDGILTEDADLADFTSKLGKIPLQYEPGTTWHYSVSVDVQGRLVEVLSGMPFDEFLEERIFEPLGMDDTAFYVPEAKMDRFAQMYSPTEEGPLQVAEADLSRNYVNEPTFFSGGGGLVSTAHDYLRFCQMLLNGGELDGVRLLSPKTIQLMTVDHTGDIENNPRESSGYGFGLGFAVANDLSQIGTPTSIGEYNWGGAAGTRFWIDPVENFIGIYMVQILPHPFTFGEEFKILAYQAITDSYKDEIE